MKTYDMPQGSPEWFAIRAGIPTASNFDCIVTTKGDPSKQADKYMLRLAGERILGMPESTYQNDAMRRGVELEPEARLCYEVMTGNTASKTGFCLADGGYGASPDGLIGDDGLLEIKCPTLATHVGYLIVNELPSEYFQQVQGQMLVTGRKWSDFVSYYPGLRTMVVHVERDEVFIGKLSAELDKFTKRLEDIINQIK